mmetsp:Transcript_3008/g.4578  ORF Transcript_3008/g.4578 Transcript_3008/m.4578 type:complete len:222 (-) Transcript_3008:205-870(-)
MTKSRTPRSDSKRTKATKLYCSKYVSTIMDRLIQSELKTVRKHTKTTEKWLSKMRSSVLKKISASSRYVFTSDDHDIDNIKSEINKTLKDIELEKTKIIDTAKNMWSKKLSTVPCIAAESKGKGRKRGDGRYHAKVMKINEKLDMMANQMSNLSKDFDSRLSSLEGIVQVVESSWKGGPRPTRVLRSQTASSSSTDESQPQSHNSRGNKALHKLENLLNEA